jgi:hypothetical protein
MTGPVDRGNAAFIIDVFVVDVRLAFGHPFPADIPIKDCGHAAMRLRLIMRRVAYYVFLICHHVKVRLYHSIEQGKCKCAVGRAGVAVQPASFCSLLTTSSPTPASFRCTRFLVGKLAT